MTHSPTPWYVSEQNKLTIWGSPYLHRIAEACIPPDNSMERKEAYANARLIVTAVNSYAADQEIKRELVEALKKAGDSIGSEGGDIQYILDVLAKASSK